MEEVNSFFSDSAAFDSEYFLNNANPLVIDRRSNVMIDPKVNKFNEVKCRAEEFVQKINSTMSSLWEGSLYDSIPSSHPMVDCKKIEYQNRFQPQEDSKAIFPSADNRYTTLIGTIYEPDEESGKRRISPNDLKASVRKSEQAQNLEKKVGELSKTPEEEMSQNQIRSPLLIRRRGNERD